MKNLPLNALISHISFTVDYICRDKEYPQKLNEYLYLIVYGMIVNYGDDYINDIYDVISKTKFIIDDFGFKNRFKLNDNLYYKNCTSNNYLFKGIDLTNIFPTINIKYELLFKNIDSSSIKTLEYLTYHLNYILCQKNSKLSLGQNIKLRFDYYKNGGFIDDSSRNEMVINKIFNLLQTEDIIKHILDLRNNEISDARVKNALISLKNTDYDSYKVEGLDSLATLVRPLYECDEIKNIINTFNYSFIEKELDSILGNNSYKKICHKLEMLNDMIHRCEIGVSSNYYELSLEYVSIRNNYVNRYIAKKYA